VQAVLRQEHHDAQVLGLDVFAPTGDPGRTPNAPSDRFPDCESVGSAEVADEVAADLNTHSVGVIRVRRLRPQLGFALDEDPLGCVLNSAGPQVARLSDDTDEARAFDARELAEGGRGITKGGSFLTPHTVGFPSPGPQTRQKTGARGYGARHQALRARLAPQVAAGLASCARCGERILPGEPWDLGHDDHDRTKYAGPEHRACNRATSGRRRRSRRW
jgi:hypothetical protein